jgi:iron(III) transport system ATP-binding protein
MNVLETRNLSKRYGSAATLALRDVSLAVRRGEVLAVVGESGSGKTTLLRVVAGLEVPTAGEVLLNGHVASSARGSVPPERRDIGIVFQDYALFPHLSVLGNVLFGLQNIRRIGRSDRAHEALALVGLESLASRFPHELSGGQQQRVALARALAPRPSLLLLDEPFSNLDVVLRQQIREEVAQILRAARTTALFVVHDLDDVLAIADRIAILKDGVLQQIDTPQAIWERPADEYVARLFGSTNLLPGRAIADGFATPVGFVPYPESARDGSRAILSIRPRDLEISRPAGEAAATVHQVRFRGDHQEVVLEVSDPDGAAHRVLVHVPAGEAVDVGERVGVRVLPGAVRMLGRDAAARDA